MREIAPLLIWEGPEAFEDLTVKSRGESGLIETEIRNVDQQDALDSLGTPPSEQMDLLSEVDEDWRSIESATTPWIETALQFRRRGEGDGAGTLDGVLRYRYSTDQQHTLVPLATFFANCHDALEAPASRSGRSIQTTPSTFRRRTALSRQGRAIGTRLLRYGDPFTTGMWTLTQADDRGRSSAMWRLVPSYNAEGPADVFFRFDFLVEADLEGTLAALRGTARASRAGHAAIARRGTMALPPFFQTIWLDRELDRVTDPAVLSLLELPYAPDARAGGGRDYHLNNERWRRLSRLELPELEFWPDLCASARLEAEAHLRALPQLTDRLDLAGRRAEATARRRLGQLRARALATASETAEMLQEEVLAAQLKAGVTHPQVRVDAVGAVFLSGDVNATLAMGKPE
jgi:ATP-dependent helicase HepA